MSIFLYLYIYFYPHAHFLHFLHFYHGSYIFLRIFYLNYMNFFFFKSFHTYQSRDGLVPRNHVSPSHIKYLFINFRQSYYLLICSHQFSTRTVNPSLVTESRRFFNQYFLFWRRAIFYMMQAKNGRWIHWMSSSVWNAVWFIKPVKIYGHL